MKYGKIVEERKVDLMLIFSEYGNMAGSAFLNAKL